MEAAGRPFTASVFTSQSIPCTRSAGAGCGRPGWAPVRGVSDTRLLSSRRPFRSRGGLCRPGLIVRHVLCASDFRFVVPPLHTYFQSHLIYQVAGAARAGLPEARSAMRHAYPPTYRQESVSVAKKNPVLRGFREKMQQQTTVNATTNHGHPFGGMIRPRSIMAGYHSGFWDCVQCRLPTFVLVRPGSNHLYGRFSSAR